MGRDDVLATGRARLRVLVTLWVGFALVCLPLRSCEAGHAGGEIGPCAAAHGNPGVVSTGVGDLARLASILEPCLDPDDVPQAAGSDASTPARWRVAPSTLRPEPRDVPQRSPLLRAPKQSPPA